MVSFSVPIPKYYLPMPLFIYMYNQNLCPLYFKPCKLVSPWIFKATDWLKIIETMEKLPFCHRRFITQFQQDVFKFVHLFYFNVTPFKTIIFMLLQCIKFFYS